MDTVLFSASPLKAFTGLLFLIVLLFLLGLLNAFTAVIPGSRRKKTFARVGTGIVAFILLLTGAAITFTTYNSYLSGDKAVQVRVVEKREVTRNCNRRICTDYVVETTDGDKYYVFGLEKDTWGVIETNACYQFTYYPVKPLLADYLQENEPQDLYETTGSITRIQIANCP